MSSDVGSGPNLLLDWHESGNSRRWFRAGAGSVAVHLVLLVLALGVASLDPPQPRKTPEIAADIHHVTPLYLPAELTQKAPNRNKINTDLSVEDLLPRPASQQHLPPSPALRTFKAPAPQKPTAPQLPDARLAEPPKIEAAVTKPDALPAQAGVPKAPPPPQIQPEEKPKLTFETVGQNGTAPQRNPALSKVPPPKTTVQDAIHSVARGGATQGGMVVGDMEPPPDLRDSMRLPPAPGKIGSQLELLSDPMGVDFKPYLIRILALVRQNWFAVIPESARLGNRGTVQLQFIIDRGGQVPKLVIAMPSGTESLDRAAVAGISASVPFPPLPQEFKGKEIRVQFSFKYNIR